MKWLRFYHEFIDDPKVSMMPDTDQLLWVKALCLASESSVRGVILLSDEEISWRLRVAKETWQCAVDKFRAKGMVEHTPDGYRISKWDERQFESDTSTERVKKHRSGKKDETLQERFGNALDTEKESDSKQIQSRSKAEDPLQAFLDIYNACKPATWKKARGAGGKRAKMIQDWIKLHGRAEALDRLEASMRWINQPNQSFWLGKPGQFGIVNISYQDRLYEWSEAWYELQQGNTLIGVPSVDAQAAISQASNAAYYDGWAEEMESRRGLRSA
jgi:hypothetical protein